MKGNSLYCISNKRWLVLTLLLAVACSSQRTLTTQPQSAEARIIKIVPNQKYQLEAVFSGADVEVGERMVPVIEHLTLRSPVMGQEVNYTPADGPSGSDARAYFTDVWSPDQEFLVLPLNRFRGFCIVRAAEAMEMIKKQTCSDTVRVSGETGIGLWHEFEKWDADGSFTFNAGLYGDRTWLKYNILKGRFTSLDRNLRFLEGENGKGKIKITPGP
jgi:hypothetical protein